MKKKITLIALLLLILDLTSKVIVNKLMVLYESKVIIPGFFALTKVHNNGASWNILAGERLILILIGLLIIVLLFFYQKNFQENKRNILAFSLLYAGIIGNLIERICYGYVTDFFDFTIFNYDYPVFNIADIYIIVGLLLLVVAILKKEDISGISSRRK